MSVYVGIDVHRKCSQVAVVTGEGTVQLNKNVVNCSEPFLRLIGDLPPGTPVAFEAAFGTPRVGPLLPRSADVTAGSPGRYPRSAAQRLQRVRISSRACLAAHRRRCVAASP
jgi:hypothetical protein